MPETRPLLSRLVYLAIAAGIALFAALFFDRFNPSRELPVPGKKARKRALSKESVFAEIPAAEARPVETHLAPLDRDG